MPFGLQLAMVAVVLVAMPLWMLFSLWRKDEANRFHWLLKTAYTSVFFVFLYLVAPWDWASYYLRYIWLILLVVAALQSYRRIAKRPFRLEGGARTWSDVISLVIFAAFVAVSLRGYHIGAEPISLAFPLQGSRFYVGQGGNSPLVNYHNTYPSQRFAVDIVALNPLGSRAKGIYPSELKSYAIFDLPVISPCDGTVTKAIDGLPDLPPPASDPDNVAGNHVVISCHGVNVLLAHFREGSVVVKEGDVVATGDVLGKVGNSGNTSEPHLHIHAVRSNDPTSLEGEAVPLLFDGRFPVRNMLFVQ